MKIVNRTIPVVLNGLEGPEDVDVTVSVAVLSIPVVVRMGKGEVQREETLRATIRAADGLPRRVLIDLYRCLVDSNFTRFNGEGGHEAAVKAEAGGYPDQGTLPDFQNVTDGFNAAGEIVWNLLRHPEPEKTGYRVLGGILLAFLDEDVLEYPTMDRIY